jgi:hypothetical protein
LTRRKVREGSGLLTTKVLEERKGIVWHLVVQLSDGLTKTGDILAVSIFRTVYFHRRRRQGDLREKQKISGAK